MRPFVRFCTRHTARLRNAPYGALAASTSPLVLVAPLSVMAYSPAVTKRPGLENAPDDAASRPHHVLSWRGALSFRNIHPSYGDGVGPFIIIRKLISLRLKGETQSMPDTSPPTVPVRKPAFLPSRRTSDQLRATWLGHACYYVEYPSGLRVLFDPVFEDRCSPFTFMGPKRYTPPPCAVADLPFVDAVVISHSHYDHLSLTTVRDIHKSHPTAHFFVGLGLEKWFRSTGIDRVTELDWWEDAELTLTPQGLKSGGPTKPVESGASSPALESISARISCLPAQHSSGRSGFDQDQTLWCSWAVSSSAVPAAAGHSVWFGGDTGYRAVPYVPRGVDDYGPDLGKSLPACPQFEQIGRLRGPFDLGLIPIGAYSPRSIFSPVHANPFDSVEIMRDTRCRRAMGIHWGTWTLTREAVLEPPALLRTALKRRGIAETGVFDVCDIGESREF